MAKQVAHWARSSFEDWGADKTKLEPYRPICPSAGSAAHMHEPQYQPFISYAVRPTRGTNGQVMSDAVFVNTGALYSKSDLQEYKRKLRNKIVFTQPLRDVEPLFKALAVRPSVAGRTRLYGRG